MATDDIRVPGLGVRIGDVPELFERAGLVPLFNAWYGWPTGDVACGCLLVALLLDAKGPDEGLPIVAHADAAQDGADLLASLGDGSRPAPGDGVPPADRVVAEALGLAPEWAAGAAWGWDRAADPDDEGDTFAPEPIRADPARLAPFVEGVRFGFAAGHVVRHGGGRFIDL